MFDVTRQHWVIRMAFRHGIDLEEQLFVGLVDQRRFEDAIDTCQSCSHSDNCIDRLERSEPLLVLPAYCENGSFFKQVEQLNCVFWRGIELQAANSMAISLIDAPNPVAIQGVNTELHLDIGGLETASWQMLQKQSLRWEWRYTSENWLLYNVVPDPFDEDSEQVQLTPLDQADIAARIFSRAELGFWLMRSAARKVGVDLRKAMEAGDFSPQKYATMVVNCCQCPLECQCRSWLDSTEGPSKSAPDGCLNSGAFAVLAEHQS